MPRREYLPHSGSKVSRRLTAQVNKNLVKMQQQKDLDHAEEMERLRKEVEYKMNAGILGFLRRVWRALSTPLRYGKGV